MIYKSWAFFTLYKEKTLKSSIFTLLFHQQMTNSTLKNIISLLILLVSLCISGQDFAEEIPDSLLQKEYKTLSDRYYEELDSDDDEGALLYAKVYLIKSKAENDSLRIGRAFKYFAFASIDTLAYRYADSIIHYTKNSTHLYYPTQGYIIKGTRLYNWGQYDKSLDNFLTAYTYAQEKNATEDLLEIRYAIGSIKNRWDSNEEALAIFKENLAYIQQQENYKTEFQSDYLIALHSVFTCYLNIKKTDSAKPYIKKGITESLALNDSARYYKFVLGSGIANYYDKNYITAVDSINKAAPHVDATTLMTGYFYKGKLFYELRQMDSAIIYFKKVDTLFNTTQDEFVELREVYQTLADYYEEKNDIKAQLIYINKLLHLDSLLVHHYKYLNKNIAQKYDTPYRIAQKETLINQLNEDKNVLNRNIVLIVMTSLLLIAGIFSYHHNRRKVYKKRFELLLQEKEVRVTVSEEKKEKMVKASGLSKDIVQGIIEKLDAFETAHGYTDSAITLHSLAKELETNSAYLSKVVNAYKNKNFAAYINELRVDYAIEKLKTDAMFRRYVVKTIAYEVGFNSSESFSKTFYKKTGVHPSYFIKQLEKQEKLISI